MRLQRFRFAQTAQLFILQADSKTTVGRLFTSSSASACLRFCWRDLVLLLVAGRSCACCRRWLYADPSALHAPQEAH